MNRDTIISWLIANLDSVLIVYCFLALFGLGYGWFLSEVQGLSQAQIAHMIIGALVFISLTAYIKVEYIIGSIAILIALRIFMSKELVNEVDVFIGTVYRSIDPSLRRMLWIVLILSLIPGVACGIYTFKNFDEVTSRRMLWRNSNVSLFDTRLRYTINRFLLATQLVFIPLIYYPLFRYIMSSSLGT